MEMRMTRFHTRQSVRKYANIVIRYVTTPLLL